MAKDFAKAFYSSKSWKAARQKYIDDRVAIDGGICEICRMEQGYIVHHKVKITERNISNPYVTLSAENLQYVCKNCHDEEHFCDINGKKRAELNCFFTEDGQPIPPIHGL